MTLDKVTLRDVLLVEAAQAEGEALARAVLAYDAALTAWGTAAAQHDRTAIQAAKDAMDTAYRTMLDLAREMGG